MFPPGHFVAIIGGAVAGSEAAARLSARKIHCAVFDQNILPYGKLETGLPKWHINLRDSQEKKIDEKLNHPLVQFVPGIRLGRDLDLTDLIQNWDFSAILLATGAWKDRPLPVKGIDSFIDRGLYYQNPFVAWFNRNHDPGTTDPPYQIYDGTVVIGGGLASLDVIKIVSIESVRQVLERRGRPVDILTLEKRGIYDVLKDLDLSITGLGLTGCTLFYRRRLIDMPLTSLPAAPTPRELEVAYRVRKKIMDNFQSKYFFNFVECYQPVDFVSENDRLSGLLMARNEVIEGKLVPGKDEPTLVKCPLVISAIGSLPEPIAGLPYGDGVFRLSDAESGQLEGFENVFALGNAVTGRGNIKESQLHGRQVSEKVMDEYLAWQEEDYREIFTRAEKNVADKIGQLQRRLKVKKMLAPGQIENIYNRIKTLQHNVGYSGDYDQWIKRHLPVRIENMLPGAG